MTAKPVEYARASAAGVDERRRPAPPRDFYRIHTKRGSAPVDVRVKIDQSGHDNQPAYVDHVTAAGGEVRPDFGYFPVIESDVGGLVAPAYRIDDAATFEH